MGYAKEQLGDGSQSFEAPDDTFVCPNCVTDSFLSAALTAALQDAPCTYCERAGAADILVLLSAIHDAIRCDYADPADVLSYDGQEGGFQGEVHDGYDLISELAAWTDCDALLDDVASAFGGTSWTDRNYYSLGFLNALQQGWGWFADQIKHRTRYLFLQETTADEFEPEMIPPGRMLDALGALFREHALFKTLPTSTELIRARVIPAGTRPCTAADLGSPPQDAANSPNRMSPAGIPMFYAAFDERTAFLETFTPGENERNEIAFARFRNLRSLQLIDLTSVPAMTSWFHPMPRDRRDGLQFLHGFVTDFCRPVMKDGREHIEYVPTQVVTEFVRHRVRNLAGARIDGICYRSSRANASVAIVVFAEANQCGPRVRKPGEPEPLLELDGVRYASAAEFQQLGVP